MLDMNSKLWCVFLALVACGGADTRFCPGRLAEVTCGADGRVWVCSLAPADVCAAEVATRIAAGEPTEGLESRCEVWSIGLDVCAQ